MNANQAPRFIWIRRILITLVGLATLIAAIYAEENWRGRRVWENCKRELQAKGESVDWSAFVPPPVPDDQNIFKAPKMAEWFVRHGTNNPKEFPKRLNATAPSLKGFDFTGAKLKIVPPGTIAEPGVAVLDLNDPAMPDKVMQLIHVATGPIAIDATSPATGIFINRLPGEIKPVQILLSSKTTPSTEELSKSLAPIIYHNVPRLQPDGTNTFRLTYERARLAADYLAATSQGEEDIALIREALKRPYARIDGNYSDFLSSPVIGFVQIRNLVQYLANQAKCHLLTGQSDLALQDLTLIYNSRRMLHAEPFGKPTTLLDAMLNVSIAGLYVYTLAGDMDCQIWSDADLIELQKQLASINLLPSVTAALRSERAGSAKLLETSTGRQIRALGENSTLVIASLVPRGCILLNLDTGGRQTQQILDLPGFKDGTTNPREVDKATQDAFANEPFRLSTFLARYTLPNLGKAIRGAARNQTLANQAYIACALERYRLARGNYPENLAALTPQYAEKLPLDITTGQPLHYKRLAGNKYLLYSVGWNETDDNGTTSTKIETGDWVWGSRAGE